jgi:hypothetical protein
VHIPTRFTSVDGEPFGIAGLWDTYKDESGTTRESYTMLTTNADTHPLLRNYHRSKDEKRMLVLLPRAQWAEWLDAPAERLMAFVSQYPAERMIATGHPGVAEGQNGAGEARSAKAKTHSRRAILTGHIPFGCQRLTSRYGEMILAAASRMENSSSLSARTSISKWHSEPNSSPDPARTGTPW